MTVVAGQPPSALGLGEPFAACVAAGHPMIFSNLSESLDGSVVRSGSGCTLDRTRLIPTGSGFSLTATHDDIPVRRDHPSGQRTFGRVPPTAPDGGDVGITTAERDFHEHRDGDRHFGLRFHRTGAHP